MAQPKGGLPLFFQVYFLPRLCMHTLLCMCVNTHSLSKPPGHPPMVDEQKGGKRFEARQSRGKARLTLVVQTEVLTHQVPLAEQK